MILNAYQMAKDIRDSLNEVTASHWTDLAILRKMNKAQAKLAMLLSMSIGDWLLVSTDLTPVNGLVTLPSNCAKPVYLENKDNGTEIQFSLTVRERQVTRITGVDIDQLEPDAYMFGEYLQINQDNYSSQVTLWYEKNVPDLHFGIGTTGSTTNALAFQVTNIPVPRDDYYNNVYVSIVGGTGIGTRALITDYTGSTGLATVSGTFSTDSAYGTETVLPEQAIVPLTQMATVELLSKPSSAIDSKYFEFAKLEMRDTLDIFKDWISTRVKNSQRLRPQEDWS